MKIKSAGFGKEGLVIVLEEICIRCQSKNVRLGGMIDGKVWIICRECGGDYVVRLVAS